MPAPTRRARLVRSLVAASAAAGLLAASACGSSDDNVVDGITLVNAGQITGCTHLSYAPFEYNDDDNNVVGFDVDMAELVGKKLGIPTKVISIEWDQITGGAAFAASKCDLGFGAGTITDERAKSVAFSDPYFNATQALLVKKDSGIKTLEDLKGKTLAVQTATTGQIYAEEHADEFGYTVKIMDESLSQFNAVLAGNVDAAINDNAPELYFAIQNPDTEVTEEFDTGEHYGFMFKKDDENADKIRTIFNEELKKIQDDGSYAEIFKKWFGQLPEGFEG